MSHFYRDSSASFYSRICHVLLAGCWMMGLTIGSFQAFYAYDHVAEFLRTAEYGRPSILGLMVSLLLPLCLCGLSVRLAKPHFILPVVCFKAYSYGFSSLSLLWSFESAGWLVCAGLLFSDFLGLLLLLWFSFDYITGKKRTLVRSFTACSTVILMLIAAEYFLISPFVQKFMCLGT